MIRVLSFGKIKNDHACALRDAYKERASHLGKIELVIAKLPASQEALDKKIRMYQQQHQDERILLLSEEGKAYTSKEFATLLATCHEQPITFVVGPAEGFSATLKQDFPLFSLSPLTMMHDLAQIMLFEQLYRCLSINKGLPYHKP